jgi:hypothetical protein
VTVDDPKVHEAVYGGHNRQRLLPGRS